jgi:hypothetical protein
MHRKKAPPQAALFHGLKIQIREILMHQGSCLCGKVKYEIHGGLSSAVYCHCSRCRKASGTAFASNAPIAEQDFVILTGAEALKDFATPAGTHRIFCANCGSPVYSRRDTLPGVLRVRLGLLDTPLAKGEAPAAHIFAASKASWFEIRDGLPQHAERQ